MAGKLTALQCKSLPDGKYTDGDGLRLLVEGDSRVWTLTFTSPANGKRREMGLGKLREVSLEKARKLAAAHRDSVRSGVDPIIEKAQRKAEGAAAEAASKAEVRRERLTLRRVTREYHEKKVEPVLTRKHAAQWLASIEQHVPAKLLDMPIGDVKSGPVLDALHEVYKAVPETGRRVRQRLDAVFDDAVLRELVPANPVKSLGRALRSKRAKGCFRALPFADVPALAARLRALPGTSSRALEFAILTTARTGEVLGMKWDEVSKDGTMWSVPARRMKAGEAHVVYLSNAARAVLERVRGLSEMVVFPSPKRDAPLSNMAMLILLRRLAVEKHTTVHGLCRSSFSTWAYETNAARPDVIEACLAHREADRVKAAYNRAQFTEERRALLAAWAAFVSPQPTENVVAFRRKKARA